MQVLAQAPALGWTVNQALKYAGACEFKNAVNSPTCRWNQNLPECMPKAPTPTPSPTPEGSGKDGKCCIRNADAGAVDCSARESYTLQVLTQAPALGWTLNQALTYAGACEFKFSPKTPTCHWNQSNPDCMPKPKQPAATGTTARQKK
ncbi:MAG: hypothetical protein EBX52_04705 [Proteobacteria bacterium]|nr:hypothetical protein [Pseudomonadota bacterium]